VKKFLSGIFLALFLVLAAAPAYAANIQIKIDGVAVASDVEPEIVDNRTMVPVRVISENLGVSVNWAHPTVTFIKDNMKVVLDVKRSTAVKNGETATVDVKPYIKNNRIMVPLRFIAETFGCDVSYEDCTVAVNTEPLIINGVKVKALQHEYHMTMGGVVQ